MKQKQRSQKKVISRCAQPSSQKNAEPNSEGLEKVPFWKKKTLRSLTKEEWESLCDGCGRCCLIKLEDEDNGDIHFTDIACRLFKAESCSCSHYRDRQKKVSDCLKLTPKVVGGLAWLPPTCAYRLMQEGRDLHWWHPLVSGSKETVHQAGISVRGRVSYLEGEIEIDDYPARIVSWPGQPEG